MRKISRHVLVQLVPHGDSQYIKDGSGRITHRIKKGYGGRQEIRNVNGGREATIEKR